MPVRTTLNSMLQGGIYVRQGFLQPLNMIFDTRSDIIIGSEEPIAFRDNHLNELTAREQACHLTSLFMAVI